MYEFIEEELARLKSEGLLRSIRTFESAQGPRMRLEGRDLILLCSNDYLGLANHPKVKEAAKEAIDRYGFGSGASRLVAGSMSPHRELEEKLAEFKGTEAALLFNSGYAANTGVIPALVGRSDVIFSDRLNHASIIDGCILSRVEVRRYRHHDGSHLERLFNVKMHSGMEKNTKLIVTDGVFSMDGDIAPLDEIVRIAELYDALVMVDDAHGTGVLGEMGRGSVESMGVDPESVDIHMGTLGKALGSCGAYIAGKKELIEYLVNKARPLIYSTALPPAAAAAAMAAIEIIENEPERRKVLAEKASFLRKGLRNAGFETMNSVTQIIPVITGESEKAVEMMTELLDKGIFVQAIRPPTVIDGTARLRVTVTSEHSYEDLQYALDSFVEVGKKTGII